MSKLNSKKNAQLIVLFFFTSFVFFFIAWYFHWQSPRDRELKKEGEKIIIQIEAFKKTNHRLPQNLKELGLHESEEGPLYYNKNKDGISYTVSYSGSSLGESTYYDSTDKIWHDF